MYCRQEEDPYLLRKAASELEELRLNDINKSYEQDGMPFPKACHKLLMSIPGNTQCVDCGNRNPDWASVTFGILFCVQCSGRHRSYGVALSRVRSISMDAWSHTHVLSMLEGGNEQLQKFYSRHGMDKEQNSVSYHRRYYTKAARFYSVNMERHVTKLRLQGTYKGRAASRRTNQTNMTEAPSTYDKDLASTDNRSVTHNTNNVRASNTAPAIAVR